MDLTIVLFIINALMGVVMFFMQQSASDTRDQLKELRQGLRETQESCHKKEDFREFKQELFDVLNELKTEIRQYRRATNGQS